MRGGIWKVRVHAATRQPRRGAPSGRGKKHYYSCHHIWHSLLGRPDMLVLHLHPQWLAVLLRDGHTHDAKAVPVNSSDGRGDIYIRSSERFIRARWRAVRKMLGCRRKPYFTIPISWQYCVERPATRARSRLIIVRVRCLAILTKDACCECTEYSCPRQAFERASCRWAWASCKRWRA